MPVLPNKKSERLTWFEQRFPTWGNQPPQIGLTIAQVTQLGNLVSNARAAFDEAANARIAAKNATVMSDNAIREMVEFGSDLIKTIRNFAETTDNPDVYALASVPPPAAPQPAGAPVAPAEVSADPNADGTITVRWKGSLANQTFYSIWRRVGSNGNFVQMGAVASKSFIDTQVPAGTTSVSYVVRAQRNNQISAASELVTVLFGQSLAA